MWWTEEKIRLYSKAARHSSFHRELALMLSSCLDKAEKIAEAGCGLGYMTNELTELGYSVRGFDSDELAVSFARQSFPSSDFALADFSTYPFTGETILAVFFGHIEDEAGLKAFTDRTDHFVYLLNEHTDYSRCSWEKSDRVEELIKASGLSFSVRHTHLFFNQIVRDEAEKERFIQLNYTQRGRVFSHETVQHSDSIEIIIDKAFSIFDIRRYK